MCVCVCVCVYHLYVRAGGDTRSIDLIHVLFKLSEIFPNILSSSYYHFFLTLLSLFSRRC